MESNVKRVLAAAAMFALGATVAVAQSLDDLNLQIHGYATQGFIYSTTNNWNTTDSTEGTAAWTEAVVNLTVEPQPKLRIGVQARYFLLGNFGNEITIDWAQADYKVNEKFGLRVGKVKSPTGLLNETQDIDPVQLWVLLPQSIYPISSRSSILSHYGGMVYGASTALTQANASLARPMDTRNASATRASRSQTGSQVRHSAQPSNGRPLSAD
jgi:hypothetical protein